MSPEARFVMVGGGLLLEKTKKLAAKVPPFIESTGRVSTDTKVILLQRHGRLSTPQMWMASA